MAGEYGFEDAGGPPGDWEDARPDFWEPSPEELGLVDPMSPEEFAYLCSPDDWKVRHLGTNGPSQTTTRYPDADTPAPPAGTLEWTAPSGRKHITHPHHDPPPPF